MGNGVEYQHLSINSSRNTASRRYAEQHRGIHERRADPRQLHSQEKLTSDYIRDFEENEESFIKKARGKHRTNTSTRDADTNTRPADVLLHIPPRGLHSLGYRWFKGLGIYDGDGNMNTMGIVFKKVYEAAHENAQRHRQLSCHGEVMESS
jgi:hypothetical protein